MIQLFLILILLRTAFHFSEERHSSPTGGVQLRREFSSHQQHAEQQVTLLGSAPPLPPKKKHITAYMEMVGPYSQPSEVELFRQSMEVYHLKAAHWQEHSENLFIARASSYLAAPPLLPPKKNKTTSTLAISPSPEATSHKSVDSSTDCLPLSAAAKSSADVPASLSSSTVVVGVGGASGPLVNGGGGGGDCLKSDEPDDGMEQLELSGELVLKQPEDDGPEVRGGGIDALIIHAAKLNKDDYLYQEAFLATYRTFIAPLQLIRKLIHRQLSLLDFVLRNYF